MRIAACLGVGFIAAGLLASVTALRASPWTTREVPDLPMPPKPVTRVDPIYPPDAEAAGVIGRADGVISIADDGAVDRVVIDSEFPLGLGFGDAAKTAVKQWRYPPHHAGDYRLKMAFRQEEDSPPLDPSHPPKPIDAAQADPTAKPSVEQRPYFQAPYPPLAELMEKTGKVTLLVWLDDAGTPAHIVIKSEEPKDWGFAEAAHNYVLALKFKNKAPGVYTMNFNFHP